MNEYKELAKNTIIFAIASIATKLISFILLPLYTRYLTTGEYAALDLSVVTQSLLFPVLSLSITMAVLRFALDKKYSKQEVFSIGILFILISNILILSLLFFNIDSLEPYKMFFIIYYLVISVNELLATYMKGTDKNTIVVYASILSSIVLFLLNYCFLKIWRMGLNGYFYAIITANIISILVYSIKGSVVRDIQFSLITAKSVKEMLKFSIPLIPNSIFWWVNSSLDKYFLMAMSDLDKVGLYAAAGKIPAALMVLVSIFQQAWNISSIKEWENNNSRFFTNIFYMFNTMVFLATSIIILLTKYIAKILFSDAFFSAWQVIPVLCVAFYYNAIANYYGSIYTAGKKTKIIFYTTGVGAVLNIVLNFLLIPTYGMLGAAIATLISNFGVSCARAVNCRKLVKIQYKILKDIINQLLVMIQAVICMLDVRFIVQILVFALLLIVNAKEVKEYLLKFCILVKSNLQKKRGL